MNKKLVMKFSLANKKSFSVSLNKPNEDLEESKIKQVMDLVVAKAFFNVKGSLVVAADSAKIVETTTQQFDLEI